MVMSIARQAALAITAYVTLLVTASTGRCEMVYVVSFTTGELVRYDSADPAGTQTPLVPTGQMVQPSALTVGPDGNLYIGVTGDPVDNIPPRLNRYDLSTGTLTTIHTFSDYSVYPGSVAFKGSDLLVGRNPLYANTGPIVLVANATGGTIAVSDYTSGGSLASSPGLALGTDGSLYVSDQTYDFATNIASGPVKRFDSSGTYVGEVIADGADGLAGPTGLVLRGNTLFTASIMTGAVLETDLGTDATQTFGSSGTPFGVGVLASLSDGGLLAGTPDGSGTINRFASDGTLIETYASGLGQIGGIATVAVPEPGTVAILAGAAVAGGLLARRRLRRTFRS